MGLTFRGSFDLSGVTRATRSGAVVGLQMAMEHLLQESRRLVPNEEGVLERSSVASVDEGTLTGAVSYDTVYARRQHEELTWRHSDGRSSKYLEGPLTSESATMAEIVAAQIRRSLR